MGPLPVVAARLVKLKDVPRRLARNWVTVLGVCFPTSPKLGGSADAGCQPNAHTDWSSGV